MDISNDDVFNGGSGAAPDEHNGNSGSLAPESDIVSNESSAPKEMEAIKSLAPDKNKDNTKEINTISRNTNKDGSRRGAVRKNEDKTGLDRVAPPSKTAKTEYKTNSNTGIDKKNIETSKQSSIKTSSNKAASSNKDIKAGKPLEIGDHSITMPETFHSMIGTSARDVSSDLLSELLSAVTRRREYVAHERFNTTFTGRSNLYSSRIAYRPVEVQSEFNRYYPPTCQVSEPFHIRFDPSLEVGRLNRADGEAFTKGNSIDSRTITTCMKGSIVISRNVMEIVSRDFFDNLIVFDMQYIFCIGHLYLMKLNELTINPGVQNNWVNVLEDVVNYVDVDVYDNAEVGRTANILSTAIASNTLVLRADRYTAQDVNVMRAIGSGIRCLRLTLNERIHVSNGLRSERIKWLLVGAGAKELAGWVAPSESEFLGFMRRFAADLTCEADVIKGYVRACSIYYGKTYSYWTRGQHSGVITGPAAELYGPDDGEILDTPIERQNADRAEISLNDARERLNRASAAVAQARDRLNTFDRYLADAQQVNWQLNENQAGPSNEMVTRFANELDRDKVSRLGYWRNRKSYVTISANCASNLLQQARAQTPSKNIAGINILMIDEERDLLIRGIERLGYTEEDARSEFDEASDAYRIFIEARIANRNARIIHHRFIPASLELGGTSLPRPQTYNYIWRCLNLVRSTTMPKWAENDVRTWFALPHGEFGNLSALIAAVITTGSSYVLHLTNLTGSVLQSTFGRNPTNANTFCRCLFVSNDIRVENCKLAEGATNSVLAIFNININPLMYFMSSFSNSFADFDRFERNAGYAAVSGISVCYLLKPLCLTRFIKKFPDIWGIGAPGIIANIEQDVNMYIDNVDRGWFADLGCSEYKNAFASRSEFKNVAYGASVVNAVFQHFDINEMICDLNVRRFARANQTGNMMGINPCDAAVWDGESRCLRIGTVVTYNWATMEVEALCFNGEGLEVRNLMQRFSFLPKNVLDAGYVLSSTQSTIVPVNFMCLDMMTDLFSKSCNILTSASHDASKRDTDEEGN